MDLPDEGVFANNNNFRYNASNNNNNNFFVASPSSILPNKNVNSININQFQQQQQKNHNKKLKVNDNNNACSSLVTPQTTEPSSSTSTIIPSSSSNLISSLPFPINQQQIQNNNNNNTSVEGSIIPNNMKVDGGNMYIQSFLPAGIQNYQHQTTTTTATVPEPATTIATMGRVGEGLITLLPTTATTSNVTMKNIETLRKKKIRNKRDQQRSQSINNQIIELRELLQENGKKFEKTDKFSTLHTVMNFMVDAENRISTLEAEYEKILAKQQNNNDNNNNDNNANTGSSNNKNKSKKNKHMIFSYPNVNYTSIFYKSPIAQATVSLDGKFIDINESFETLTGFLRYELLTTSTTSSNKNYDNNNEDDNNNNNSSLFHILDTPETVEIVCKAMSRLIECSDNNSNSTTTTAAIDQQKAEEGLSSNNNNDISSSTSCCIDDNNNNNLVDDNSNNNNLDNNSTSRFWQGNVCSKKYPNLNLQMTITLAKSIDMDVPLLFQCTFTKK